jgi:hydroxypyruvate reductase
MAKPFVLVLHPLLAPLLPLLQERYDAIAWWEEGSAARLDAVEALVVAGEFRLDPAWLETMPRLKLIACFTVGYDGVDVGWARARGIDVAHAQDANGEDVADLAIGLIVAHRRGIVEGDHMVRSGGWQAGPKRITRSLGGARIGIVGLGGIGTGVARRTEAMGMQVAWWGPRPKLDAFWPRADSLIDLARDSDILVVAPRAFAGNVGMIDAAVMAALGPDGLLVNVSRGQVVDEDALIAALRAGTLGGAALDVFREEPTDPARWADVPRTVLAPHGGGATDAAVARMTQMLLANLAAHFAGRPLPTPVREAG